MSEFRCDRMNAEELIKELEKVPGDTEIQISVYYTKCWHVQYADNIHYFKPGKWFTILGKK